MRSQNIFGKYVGRMAVQFLKKIHFEEFNQNSYVRCCTICEFSCYQECNDHMRPKEGRTKREEETQENMRLESEKNMFKY